MSREEYDALNVGDQVWGSMIQFSTSGRLSRGLLAKLEKIDKPDRFKVIESEKGSLVAGDLINVCWNFGIVNLFKTREEAIERWNSEVYNTIDRLTSKYEQATKNVKKKLICCG